MSIKSDKKEVTLEVRLHESGFPRSMFFNRFRIEREQGFCILRFGLVSGAGELLDHFSCLITVQTLSEQQNSLVNYLEQIGLPAEKPQAWPKVLPSAPVSVIDLIIMVARDKIAETSMSFLSHSAAAHKAQTAQGSQLLIESQPAILLRSAVELQKQLIVALYEE